MKNKAHRHNHSGTAFILLDTGKCEACWKCRDKCHKKVIGRVNVFWHKHARIVNGNDCTGCLKCIKVCEYNAITEIPIKRKKEAYKKNCL